MRKTSCAECCYLNKAEKEESILNRYRYRCMFSRRDYIVGSIQKDSELKTMGCSDCNRIEIGTLFKLKSETSTYTREDKIEFRKKIAKAKKERYIREHGSNRN